VCVKRSKQAQVVVLTVFMCVTAWADETTSPPQVAPSLLASDFEGDLTPWRADPLPRMGSQPLTLFTQPDGNRCLRADSVSDFRAYGVKLSDLADDTVDIADWPMLSWRWQVSAALTGADATKKAGDDYAARLYLVFSNSRWNPLAVRTLVYIWDNKLPVGTMVSSTWALKRGRMVVLRSGDLDAGRWVTESRNVHTDFVDAFGYEPPALRALVVAADTDQTGERVTTFFDDIYLSRSTDNPQP